MSVEVITTGPYVGYLIAYRSVPRVLPPARVFRYWLLDADGKDVGEIGEEESAIREFRDLQEIRKRP